VSSRSSLDADFGAGLSSSGAAETLLLRGGIVDDIDLSLLLEAVHAGAEVVKLLEQ
jgi:hypothetical protein